ncbi:MAG: phosphoribosyltransferase domain-containing protein [Lachnospiraceae bacterium]|nr:phosphoribosyltransferase domain-containing protein [Lachnospiraceae bacterium]
MYSEADLVGIAKRENNNKRNYLVVNKLQGKHVPVGPAEAMGMFKELAGTIKGVYEKERLLLVGFAETATAIGAAVAIELGTKYIQTTREIIPGVEYIFFSEEHSHATEQKLVKDDIDSCIGQIDRIVFIEDEVTTGKTILNIITLLEKQYSYPLKFAVASILNGMDEVALQTYAKKEISLHYLVKTNHDAYTAVADGYAGDGLYVSCDMGEDVDRVSFVSKIEIEGMKNARRLVDALEYQKACEGLSNKILDELEQDIKGKVLVLGTEEFMYPALYVAGQLENRGMAVKNHATTRSPIAVSTELQYPLHERYELRSLYDRNRVTYVYDIGSYDLVLVITDAKGEDKEGFHSLINALQKKNSKIVYVRWY